MTPDLTALPWFLLGLLGVLGLIVWGCLRDDLKRGRMSAQAVEDFLALDPALLETFGSRYVYDGRPTGELHYGKLHRIAETKRHSDEARVNTVELDETLAKLNKLRQKETSS